jgi:DNA-binding transcriptional MocR family regulator
MVPLGAAIPSPSYLPTQQLNRIQSAIARRSTRGSGTYDCPPGVRELRVQVARRYLEAGCALSPDDLITTCGCQEALSLCLRAVARAGDVVAIESPTYYGHLQTLDALGLRAMEIGTCPRTGICLDALRAALGSHAIKAVLVVATCHNPLGSVMPEEKKRALVELAAEFDVPLIEDDVYADLAYAPPRPRACKAYDCSPDGSVLLCGSFSKTLAPGARVGYAAPGRFRDVVERLKFCTTLATPTLPQLALAQYLAGGAYDRHLRRMTGIYAENMRLVSGAVGKSFPDGTRVTRPAGGFVLWVEMPRSVDALELHAQALRHKINVAPGPIFSAKGAYKNFIRLNCGYPFTEEIERAIFTVGRLANAMADA